MEGRGTTGPTSKLRNLNAFSLCAFVLWWVRWFTIFVAWHVVWSAVAVKNVLSFDVYLKIVAFIF